MSWTCVAGRALRSAKGFFSCGDAIFTWAEGPAGLFAVVDALGHGPSAAASARLVSEALARCVRQPLQEVFAACDRALVHQRSVVLSAIQVRGDAVGFAGIGNVEIYGPPGVSRPPTSAGVVGRGLRSVREWPLHVEGGQRWALASDGLHRRPTAAALLDTRQLSPDEAAARILQRAGREDDDASVLVIDWTRA